MKKIASVFFLLFLFLLPSNLKFLVYQSSNLLPPSDFGSFFVYPGEILLLLAYLFFPKTAGAKKRSGFQHELVLLFLAALLAVPSFFLATDKILGLLSVIRILECVLIIYLLYHRISSLQQIIIVLAISMGLQSLLALIQYWQQGSLGLSWLGESVFGPGTLNVAKIDFLHQEIVRSYGTFPHPNLLGGFGSVTILLLLIFRDSFKKIPAWILPIVLALITLGLFVTFSRSALLGVTAGILLFFIFTVRKRTILPSLIGVCCILLALSFLFPWNRFQEAAQENSQRIGQYQQSFQLMRLYPLGTGLGNYLIALDTLPVQTNDWDKQPVHNTFLQVSNELGIMTGIFLICLLLSLCCKLLCSPHKNLLALLATISIPLLTDHYFFTSFQGIILLGLVLGIILQQNKRDHPIET